jgi:hypothetical protein
VQLALLAEREEVWNFTQRDEVMPAAPYFDAEGELRWGGPEPLRGLDRCPSASLSRSGRLLRVWPRIEQIDCHTSEKGTGPEQRWLIGFRADGRVAWQTSLLARAGTAVYAQYVASWHGDRLNLDSLAMVDASNGAFVGPIDPDSSVARFRFPGPVVWLANAQRFLLYEPHGYQEFDTHSVLQLEPRSGAVARVAEGGRKWPWARWQVTDMIALGDSPWVVVAQELAWRGPRDVALAALDRRSGRWVQLARPCASGNCREARLALAGNGDIGFGYRDLAHRKTVLLTYRFEMLAAPSDAKDRSRDDRRSSHPDGNGSQVWPRTIYQ